MNEKQITPQGTYKIYFDIYEQKGQTICKTGKLVNYYNGNIVLENDIKNEITILKYNQIIQLFKIKDE